MLFASKEKKLPNVMLIRLLPSRGSRGSILKCLKNKTFILLFLLHKPHSRSMICSYCCWASVSWSERSESLVLCAAVAFAWLSCVKSKASCDDACFTGVANQINVESVAKKNAEQLAICSIMGSVTVQTRRHDKSQMQRDHAVTKCRSPSKYTQHYDRS